MALNILIVDDSPVMRIFLRKVLHLTGLPVSEYCEAGDGEAAHGSKTVVRAARRGAGRRRHTGSTSASPHRTRS